jgi:hypothetical protein
MTFTEAAVEVLRSVGKPLHYKKITEIAIEKNLLSHVGKTPETTMSSRLATMVKKDRGDAPIVKVKPGVFALRESAEEPEEETADSATPESDAPEPVETAEAQAEPGETGDAPPAEASSDESSIATQELPGADVFPQEDDDDELILANLDDDAGEGKRPRRRRSRRRRDRDSDSGGAEARSERRPSSSRRRPRKEPQAPATRAAQVGEPVGRDLSDAIETALRGRSRQARTLHQVAEALIEGGRLSGSAATLAPTLSAAIRGDNAKRLATGRRPRFREGEGQVALLEWELPNEAVNAERDAIRAADRQRQSIRRTLIRRLKDLPDGALLELLATWLNAVGVHSLRAVRSEAGDFNLAGTLRRGPEETPLAISIYRGRQAVDNDAVVALRGRLHDFDHARIGWVITLGKAAEAASTEAHAEGAAPCAVFDGDALASSMEEVGVGLSRMSLPLAVLDIDLLDSLGAGAGRSAKAKDSAGDDESADSNGNKRRRGRRRGRGRGERAEGGEEEVRAESTDSDEASAGSEPSEKAAEEAPSEPESAPEPAEDTDKKAEAAPKEPAAEADAL